MAESQTTVALNIGSQRISMAVFDVSKSGGLVLKGYGSESVAADPALEATRAAQTRVAINDLAQRLKVGRLKARYAVSGQSVFTRFVKLPPLEQEDIDQVVKFEAQQHVPFPLDEVVWDYELIQGTADKEVVIVAIKSEALDEINAAVSDSGLGTAEVDVAPMALYNSFRAAYPDCAETVLLIDIGARTSNLLYVDGKRFFTRSIGIGGSSVTSAISKEYGISFLEAEQQKVSNGLVALGGGHTEQLDEAVAALAMVIRNALSRLPAEIARTTNYFRSQHGGSAPRRVLLAGGGANLPFTLEFFEEKLGLPVEFFNPVVGLAVGKGVDPAEIQREGHLMGELVGLGLRGIGKSEINIDLVPSVVEKARAARRRRPFLVAAAAVFLAGMAAWAVCRNIAAAKAEEQARSMKEQLDSISRYSAPVTRLLKQEQQLREVADAYASIEDDHSFWPDLLEELRNTFSDSLVWITDLEPLAGFDPANTSARNTVENAANGASVVKGDFASAKAQTSALLDKTPESSGQVKRPARGGAKAPELAANAVLIRGLLRSSERNQRVVTDMVEQLRKNSSCFSFSTTDKKGKATPITNDVTIGTPGNVAGKKPEELAVPFLLTLPLARDVAAK
jgi:type IV pilus assembly protein PilM